MCLGATDGCESREKEPAPPLLLGLCSALAKVFSLDPGSQQAGDGALCPLGEFGWFLETCGCQYWQGHQASGGGDQDGTPVPCGAQDSLSCSPRVPEARAWGSCFGLRLPPGESPWVPDCAMLGRSGFRVDRPLWKRPPEPRGWVDWARWAPSRA